MGMMLTSNELRQIADRVDFITEADLDVTQFRLGGHLVFLRRKEGGDGKVTYDIRGISSDEKVGRLMMS